jgi:hypothetical protein
MSVPACAACGGKEALELALCDAFSWAARHVPKSQLVAFGRTAMIENGSAFLVVRLAAQPDA